MKKYLAPSYFINSDHPTILFFVDKITCGLTTEKEKAIALYEAVRDGVYYDPYDITLKPEAFQAHKVIEKQSGFCIDKAVLLAAVLRAAGIPARLGFADVKNHLTTKRLIEKMGTDTFVYHGYTDVYLDGKWLKATPTFNKELCEKFGVEPLPFDGENDAILHPFNGDGEKYMEYVKDRGVFDDLPFEDIVKTFLDVYPELVNHPEFGGDFAAEATAENNA